MGNIPKDEQVKNLEFNLNIHKKMLEVFQPGEFFYHINNVRHGELEYISPSLEQVLGYPADDVDLNF